MKKLACVVLLSLSAFISPILALDRIRESQQSRHTARTPDQNAQQQQEAGDETTKDPCALCALPNPQSLKRYIYDVRPGYTSTLVGIDQGHIKKQKTSFRKGDEVHVYIVNMNPFLYEYSVKINEKTVVETAQLAFLKAFSPLFADANVSPAEVLAPPPDTANSQLRDRLLGNAENERKICPEDIVNKTRAWYEGIKDVERKHHLFLSFSSNFSQVKEQFRQVQAAFNDSLADCQSLCKAAKLYQDTYDSNRLPDEDQLSAMKDAQAKAEAIRNEIAALRINYSNCSVLKQLLLMAEEAVANAKADAPKIEVLRKRICENKPKFDQLKSNIDIVFLHPEVLLRQEHQIGKYDDNTEVTITVSSKARTLPDPPKECEPDKQVPATTAHAKSSKPIYMAAAFYGNDKPFVPTAHAAQATARQESGGTKKDGGDASQAPAPAAQAEVKLSFGRPLFSLSGGIVFSRLENSEYKSVLGFPLKADGTPDGSDISGVVGLTNTSRKRLGPMLLLNTGLFEFRDVKLIKDLGLHLSAGITGKKDKDIDIEYLFGPSLSILDRKLFFTVGAYVGKQQRLGNGLFPGAKVSDKDLRGLEVAQKEFHAKLGFGVSFKIR